MLHAVPEYLDNDIANAVMAIKIAGKQLDIGWQVVTHRHLVKLVQVLLSVSVTGVGDKVQLLLHTQMQFSSSLTGA